MKIDLTKIVDVEMDGIDHKDSPDFCDAFVSSGWYQDDKLYRGSVIMNGKWYRPLTDEELDYINDECRDYVLQQVEKWLF